MIGGAGIGSSPTMPDDHNQWNGVLLCTGANACGKVYFPWVMFISVLIVCLTERLLETGVIHII